MVQRERLAGLSLFNKPYDHKRSDVDGKIAVSHHGKNSAAEEQHYRPEQEFLDEFHWDCGYKSGKRFLCNEKRARGETVLFLMPSKSVFLLIAYCSVPASAAWIMAWLA